MVSAGMGCAFETQLNEILYSSSIVST